MLCRDLVGTAQRWDGTETRERERERESTSCVSCHDHPTRSRPQVYSLEPARVDRLNERHLHLATLGVAVLLDRDVDRHLVKHSERHIPGKGDAVVLRVKLMLVLLERDQALDTESAQTPNDS